MGIDWPDWARQARGRIKRIEWRARTDPWRKWAKTRASNRGRKRKLVKTAEVLRLVETQEHRCALTGRKLQPDDAQLDHIVPLSKGGAHEVDNLQVVVAEANRAKGSMHQAEFIAMCHAVVDEQRRQRVQQREAG